MSIDFRKNKGKRSRSSSNENNSFIKNVTSKMSSLSATIGKWFSSPNTSNSNGSAPTADATDSSTEDEAPDAPATPQPPAKRMRYTPAVKSNHYNAADANESYSVSDVEPLEPDLYATVQTSPSLPNYRRDYVAPIPSSSASVDSFVEKDVTFKPQPSASLSVATKRKSLFDLPSRPEKSEKACASTCWNTIRDPKDPYFKPSLLGSPFYPGRTNYGGASAAYMNYPNIRQKNIIVKEASTVNNAISHSTQRVMELLEQFSSPLNEARRIPPYERPTSLRRSSDRSQYADNSMSSYKWQELHVPGIASILQLKKRSRLMDTTLKARQLIASHSSTLGFNPPYVTPEPATQRTQSREETGDASSNLVTKIKARVTRQNRSETSDLETMPLPINLPTAVLHIDKDQLPKFSFGTSSVSKLATSNEPRLFSKVETTTQVTETKTMTMPAETPICKPETVSNNNNPYKFSSPITIASETSQEVHTPPKFTFGSPERNVDQASVEKISNPSLFVGKPKENDIKQLIGMKTKDWQCPTCWVSNKTDVDRCVCCEEKRPSLENEKPKCAVCKRGDSQPHCSCAPKIKPTSTTTVDLTKWKCVDCWVNNDVSCDTCVCCAGKKPNAAPATSIPVVNNVEVASEWKCDYCWIKNKSNVTTCAACGVAKPSDKKIQTSTIIFNPPSKTSDATFQNIVNAQTDKWECANCLVRNSMNKSKCACCDTERSGTAMEPENKLFNFGVNTSFKFGIDLKLQEANADKLTGTSDKSTVEESETNNNVLSTAPSFSFGLPPKKSEDKTDSSNKVEQKTDGAPKIDFVFGIPKATTEPQSVASMFSTANKLPEPIPKIVVTETEKPQEVPKIDFSVAKAQETSKPLPNFFALPLSTMAAQDKSDSVITSENKETSGNVLLLPVVATSTEAMPQPIFTFTTAGKPAESVYPVPATTAATMSITFAPVQNATSSSAINIFQKNEPTTTSTVTMFNSDPATTSVPLFGNSETTTVAAPPSLGAAAPLFSFGTKTQSAAQIESEKPKFNFSFGNNNSTETTTIFKPTFGSTDNNSNKFALGTGNAIGSGNIPGTTPAVSAKSTASLGGGTALPTNPLGGNELNPLSNANALPATSSIFGAAIPKETLWAPNNNNNLFVTNTLANNTNNNLFVTNSTSNSAQNTTPQKAFSFGSAMPFNATSAAPFGTNSPAAPAFGSNSQAPPAFGSNSPANMFGLPNQNTSNQPMFASAGQSQGAANMFGGSASSPAQPLTMFGTPSVPAATFGAPNASLPPFEAPSQAAPAPPFNFGVGQPSGIFGFGQSQQQQPQQQSSGIYNFGAVPGASPQVQFNMGSAPNTAVRRVRKAVRRNTPR